MIAHRVCLLLFLFLFAAVPVFAMAGGDDGRERRSTQHVVASVPTPTEGLDGRRLRIGIDGRDAKRGTRDTSDGARQSDAETSSKNEGPGLASVLFVFLAISVVFEAAMSALFDWRIYIRYFEGRGVKTPILVGVALLVCFHYDLDILHNVLEGLGRSEQKQQIGMIITAFLISGGSSAVFQVYSNLGLRDPTARKQKAKEERAAMAEDTEANPDDSIS